MIIVDDPTLRDLIAKHQESMAGASALSLFASLAYAIIKQFDLKRAAMAAALGTLFSASGYFFLAEYLHLGVIFIVPIGLGAGFGAYPIVKAYTNRDGSLADWFLDRVGKKDKGP